VEGLERIRPGEEAVRREPTVGEEDGRIGCEEAVEARGLHRPKGLEKGCDGLFGAIVGCVERRCQQEQGKDQERAHVVIPPSYALAPFAGGREADGRVAALDVVEVPEVFREEHRVPVTVGCHLALVLVLQLSERRGVV
jgi:hypothetical protein